MAVVNGNWLRVTEATGFFVWINISKIAAISDLSSWGCTHQADIQLEAGKDGYFVIDTVEEILKAIGA